MASVEPSICRWNWATFQGPLWKPKTTPGRNAATSVVDVDHAGGRVDAPVGTVLDLGQRVDGLRRVRLGSARRTDHGVTACSSRH